MVIYNQDIIVEVYIIMSKRLIKPISLILAVFTVMALFSVSSWAATTTKVTSGDFVFNVGKNAATVIEYKGSAAKVTVPSKIKNVPVTAIGDYAFWEKSKMTSVTIPESVKIIGEAAFNKCTSLKTVNFSKNITTIGVGAFNECTSLVSVVLPENLVNLKDAAFWYCTNLKKVLIGEKATKFGSNVFSGCKNVTLYVTKGTKAETFAKAQKNLKVGYRYTESLSASKTLSLQLGASSTLKVKTTPSVVYNSTLSYTSSNTKVVTVTSKGVIKAVGIGAATVTVKAKDGSGKYFKTKVTVIPEKIVGIKQSGTTATSYKLSWPKIDGATQYRVYKLDSKTSAFVKVAETKNNYYTFKNLALGSKDKYKIRAVSFVGKTAYISPSSGTKTSGVLRPGKTSGLTVSAQSESSITLKWSKANNAHGYRIYKYDSTAKKPYTYVGQTTALTYTVMKLSANTSYSFVVRAYVKNAKNELLFSAYTSPASSYTLPAKVKGLVAVEGTVSSNKLTLSWTPLLNISSYDLSYKAADESTWQTVNLPSDATSYMITNLKSSSVYNFKIRAVRVADGKTYKGSYCAVYEAQTTVLPTTKDEAVSGFKGAFENTAVSEDPCILFVQAQATGLTEETKDPVCESILNEIAESVKGGSYNFAAGKETKTGLSIGETIAPGMSENPFTAEKVLADTVSFGPNGAGYSLSFDVNDESGAMFIPAVDWDTLSKKYGFTLDSVTYTTKLDNIKVQANRFDTMKVSVDFVANITSDSEPLVLSGTLEYLYIFIWA